jgi:hypothetical protein
MEPPRNYRNPGRSANLTSLRVSDTGPCDGIASPAKR